MEEIVSNIDNELARLREALEAALQREAQLREKLELHSDLLLPVNDRLRNTDLGPDQADYRSRLAIEAAAMGSFEWDFIEKHFISSPRLRTIFGFSQEESPTHLQFQQAIHPDDLYIRDKAVEQSFQTGALNYEVRLRWRDGSIKWVKVYGRVAFGPDGKPAKMYGLATDISDQKIAETNLRANEERWRMAIESTKLGTWDYYPATGILNWSQECKNIYCLPANTTVDFGQFADHIFPADREWVLSEINRSMSKGGAGNYDIQYRIVTYGEPRVRWIRATGKVYFDGSGEPERFIGTVLDITDEKAFADALEQQVAERTEALKKTSELLVVSNQLLSNKNRELEQQIFNDFKETLSGYNSGDVFFQSLTQELSQKTGMSFAYLGEAFDKHPEECFIRTFSFFAHGEHRDNIEYALPGGPCEEVMKGTLLSYAEGCWLSYPGNQGLADNKIESYVGCPLVNAEGKIIGLLVLMHTEKLENIAYIESMARVAAKRAEMELERLRSERLLAEKNAALEQQNAELASFSFVASHDLQEPLRKIQTFAGRIVTQESDQLTENGLHYFSRIIAAAERMQQLIEDLLSYSRTNSGEVSFQDTQLSDLVEDVLQQLKENMEEKNAQVLYDQLPRLALIPVQGQQLFYNILSNAIKYSRPGVAPVINLSAEKVWGYPQGTESQQQGRYWKISIYDNGIGFNNDYRLRIFELFQRLHTRQEYPGTGLGLAICKKIMLNHHGAITAEGRPGEGSSFFLYFPVKEV